MLPFKALGLVDLQQGAGGGGGLSNCPGSSSVSKSEGARRISLLTPAVTLGVSTAILGFDNI